MLLDDKENNSSNRNGKLRFKLADVASRENGLEMTMHRILITKSSADCQESLKALFSNYGVGFYEPA